MNKNWYWQLRLSRWPPRKRPAVSGYTLLIPVPADIPVFLALALKVCSQQEARHRVRTLVIPDSPSEAVVSLVNRSRTSWDGPLDIALLPRPERWILPYLKSGSRNHGLQLVRGVSRSSTTHVLLHDADLFPLDRGLLDSQYQECRRRDLDCLGVSPAWDPWYAERGLRLAATWDMVASLEWLRGVPPYRHIGHDGVLFGERHTFDTTFYAQAVTPASRVDWTDRSADFVHFNYVITTYRRFQRRGPGFTDDSFRLLLIALFVHLFDAGSPPAGLPPLLELPAGLGNASATVYFPADPEIAAIWFDFRARLDRMLAAENVPTASAATAAEVLAVFDDFYSRWQSPSSDGPRASH